MAAEVQQAIPLGRPIARTHIYILDSQLRRVPPGMIGEICIAGAALARGYVTCPDLTAERFVPNPYGLIPGERLYRTGDLGRFDARGTILFAGRTDQQIKIRGRRIEIGEIEAALQRHPAIRQSVVRTLKESRGELATHLAAYVVREDETLSADGLRSFLQRTLPAFMVPTYFVFLAELPLTPSGKVDRLALPRPSMEVPDSDSARTPLTAIEATIAAIWSRLLRRDRIGAEENFFDAGGHSLQLVQVAGELRRAFGQQVEMLDLLTNPTIRSLASLFVIHDSAAPVTEGRGRVFDQQVIV
jgi:acyl carrier protein